MKIYCGGDFLCWIQNAHIYYFTLKTLKNIMKKSGYDFVCGNEKTNICSLFKSSLIHTGYNLKLDYESDYVNSNIFLRKMEFYRFLPTAYNIKRVTISMLINFLKQVGLYNVTKKYIINLKIKTFFK